MTHSVFASPGRRARTLAVLLGLVLTLSAALVPGARAQTDTERPLGCGILPNTTYERLLRCVTVEGVRAHQAAFQAIADANGGTRASGTPGYQGSVDYVVATLEGAGYDVTTQDFDFPFFQETAPPTLAQVSPDPTTYGEVVTFQYSGSGTVTGVATTPVDVQIPPPAAPGSTSGCEPEDFASFPAGNVALLQRGTCTFEVKVDNAVAAGAVAVIIFNEGQEGRTDPFVGGLGRPFTIPVVGVGFAAGADLADPAGTVVSLSTSTIAEIRTTQNVIADSPSGNDDNVVVAGAHLDSVIAGPGINDNGSGSAAILEVAVQMRRVHPVNQLRFAFWGAEELGLLGSEHYVSQLSAEEVADLALYLNFDMVGSPNFVRFIYDGDQSAFEAPVPVPSGSEAIEHRFEAFFNYYSLPTDPTEFSGRSDYQAFILADVPAGGLFTGAEGIKTPEQQAIYGGTAGEQYDPCYHEACDTLDNNSNEALGQMSDAIAYTVLTYAYSTEEVNGAPGEPVPAGSLGLLGDHDNGDGQPGRGVRDDTQAHTADA